MSDLHLDTRFRMQKLFDRLSSKHRLWEDTREREREWKELCLFIVQKKDTQQSNYTSLLNVFFPFLSSFVTFLTVELLCVCVKVANVEYFLGSQIRKKLDYTQRRFTTSTSPICILLLVKVLE